MTLEDLIEEIVGEIEDEYDVEEMSYREIDEKNFLIDAGMTLEKFNQIFQTTIDSDEVDTMAGIILEDLGYFPEDDEVVEVRQEKCLIKTNISRKWKNSSYSYSLTNSRRSRSVRTRRKRRRNRRIILVTIGSRGSVVFYVYRR